MSERRASRVQNGSARGRKPALGKTPGTEAAAAKVEQPPVGKVTRLWNMKSLLAFEAVREDEDEDEDEGEDGPEGSLYARMSAAFVLHPKFGEVMGELTAAIDQCHGVEDEPPCLHVIGPSGAGKSTLMLKLKERYPGRRDGLRYRLRGMPDLVCDEMPVLITRIPPAVSPLTLGRTMLEKYGDPNFDRGDLKDVEKRLRLYISRCKTRAIVLDDAQRAIDRNGTVVKALLVDWLKELHQSTGTILILVGLSRMLHLFADDGDQFDRRYDAALHLPPYRWIDACGIDCTAEQDQFNAIVAAMMKLSPLPFDAEVDVCNDNEAMSEMALRRFYYASQGLIGMLAKLLKRAMRIVMRDPAKHRSVSLALLHEAFEKGFKYQKKGMRNCFAPDWAWELPPPVADDRPIVRAPAKAAKRLKRHRQHDLRRALTK